MQLLAAGQIHLYQVYLRKDTKPPKPPPLTLLREKEESRAGKYDFRCGRFRSSCYVGRVIAPLWPQVLHPKNGLKRPPGPLLWSLQNVAFYSSIPASGTPTSAPGLCWSLAICFFLVPF